jgi:hypothetical protein
MTVSTFQSINNAQLAPRDELIQAAAAGGNQQAGRRIILSSFTGSHRHRKLNELDSLALVCHFGPPTFLITVTLNTNHPGLTQLLGPGENAFSRPDLTARFFHLMLRAVKERIRVVFSAPLGGVAYFIHVIESQKRGLPHSHILLRTVRQPSLAELPRFISAELPDQQQHPIERNLVEQLMLHVCSARCRRQGSLACKYRFPADSTDVCYTDEFGFTHYRRTPQDANVVAYNPDLLCFFRSHTHQR